MEIRIFETEAGVDKAAADYVAARITEKKGFVLGLPTGGTPEGMYAKLVDKVNKGDLVFIAVGGFLFGGISGHVWYVVCALFDIYMIEKMLFHEP